MRLTIWRHGEAGPGSPDRSRTLTKGGVLALHRRVLDFANREICGAGQAPTRILHSPWVRTTQTAKVLGEVLGIHPESADGLAPGAGIASADPLLENNSRHTVLVGHQPFVSELIWFWLDACELPPLAPGGWATVELIASARGAAHLLDAEVG